MRARRLPGRRNAVGEGARPRHAKIVGTLSVHRAGGNRVEHVGGQQPALGDDGFHRALAFADTNVALRRARRRMCAPGLRRCILRQMQMPSVGMALRRLAATDGGAAADGRRGGREGGAEERKINLSDAPVRCRCIGAGSTHQCRQRRRCGRCRTGPANAAGMHCVPPCRFGEIAARGDDAGCSTGCAGVAS